MHELITRLQSNSPLSQQDFVRLIHSRTDIDPAVLFQRARATCQAHYGNRIFLRGLIEVSNHCQNDCYYCGIRKSNRKAVRYRLTSEQIVACCQEGYELGLRTFVFQGGEDPWFTDERLCRLISTVKQRWPDTALTLSLGERSRTSYERLYQAGGDRYLLRHETADDDHYRVLHPHPLSMTVRQRCLREIKEIGFQTGAGFMVGSPGQTAETLAADLSFLQALQPHMVGIGPFIPHSDTPFAHEPPGTADLTLFLLALVRLLLPTALLPATTALGTVTGDGWERGVLAGANVIMPNLTPKQERAHYQLYDGKNPTPASALETIANRMQAIGYHIVTDRGDHRDRSHSS